MTEIEFLITQAAAIKATKLGKPKAKPWLTGRTWQEILDNKPYPKLRIGKL